MGSKWVCPKGLCAAESGWRCPEVCNKKVRRDTKDEGNKSQNEDSIQQFVKECERVGF